MVESLRGHLNLNKAGMKDTEPVHNSMVGRQALSPSLDDPQWCADVEFDAPTTPGEYKIVVHVRSSTMIGARPLGHSSTRVTATAVKACFSRALTACMHVCLYMRARAGVDAKRKVSFSVCSSKAKRSLPSSSSHSSTEGTEPCDTMEAMDAAIAEIEEVECGGDASAARDAAAAARASGGSGAGDAAPMPAPIAKELPV